MQRKIGYYRGYRPAFNLATVLEKMRAVYSSATGSSQNKKSVSYMSTVSNK